MLGRELARTERIGTDGDEVVGGLIYEDDIQCIERLGGQCGRGDSGHDDTVYLPVTQLVDVTPDGVHLVGFTQEYRVSLGCRDLFGAGDNARVGRIIESRHDHPDRIRPPPDESLGEKIRTVPQFRGDLENALAGLLRDPGIGVSREDQRDGGLGDPGPSGDLSGCYTMVANTHCWCDNRYWQTVRVKRALVREPFKTSERISSSYSLPGTRTMPTLEVNDATLHYEEVGRGAAVLLLHGLGSSAADWAPQMEVLKSRYRVIALDMRGSGTSRDLKHPGGPFSVSQFAADATALLGHLAATPAHIVGLSMGGMIAFQMAVDFPDAVRSMVIVNSGPALVPRTGKERRAFAIRRLIARVWGPRGMGKMLAKRLFPHPDHGEKRRLFIESMARNDKRAYIASQEAIIGWSVLDRIGDITVPVLVVASDQDYTPVALKEAYASRMKRAEVVVVADARHALPLEFPEKLNPILATFLDHHSAAAGR